jgi:hypothetical protein
MGTPTHGKLIAFQRALDYSHKTDDRSADFQSANLAGKEARATKTSQSR